MGWDMALIHDAVDSINSRSWSHQVLPSGMESRSSALSERDMVDELLTIMGYAPQERIKDRLTFRDSNFHRCYHYPVPLVPVGIDRRRERGWFVESRVPR